MKGFFERWGQVFWGSVVGGVLILLALWATGALAAIALVCTGDGTGMTTLNIDVCDHYVLWKTGPNSFRVVCPGGAPPVGAVELREYYNFKIFGG